MATLYFVTHPEVVVDPHVAVPRWGLSDLGFARVRLFAAHGFLHSVTRVVSSEERKATDAGAIIANACGVALEIRADLGEHDRSSTGFVAGARFDALVDAFFGSPDTSTEGWVPASTEQHRIVSAVDVLLEETSNGDVLVVSHGGVGTLLLCALNDWPIERRRDQPGQGHWFAVDSPTRRTRHGWIPLEHAAPIR